MADSANTTPARAIPPAPISLTKKGEAYAGQSHIYSHQGMEPGAPALALRPVSCPIGVDPAEWRQAITARIEELQDAQWALVAALDQMEPDPDLEEDGTEHDSSWPNVNRGFLGGAECEDDELDDPDEDSDPGEEHDHGGGDVQDEPHDDQMFDGQDCEPSLGWSEWRMDQSFPYEGGADDLEGTDNALGGDPDAEHDMRRAPGGQRLIGDRVHYSPPPVLIRHEGLANPPVSPALFPPQYVMRASGHCMEPEIPDGARLLFERDALCLPGDVVAIFRRPESVAPGEHAVLVKELLHITPDLPGTPGGMLVLMRNPRKLLFFPKRDVVALHKCLGPVASDAPTYPVSFGHLMADAAIVRRDAAR